MNTEKSFIVQIKDAIIIKHILKQYKNKLVFFPSYVFLASQIFVGKSTL
jgi:hypothetical protein